MSAMNRLFLALSRSQRLCSLVVRIPLARRISRRFVAGDTIEEAIEVVRGLNQKGVKAAIDHLGESISSREEAIRAGEEYLCLLDQIADSGVDCNVSLKLTHLGLDIDFAFCQENVARIVERAQGSGNFVRIDMENSARTERTIGVYRALRERYHNVGVAIQSYLYRSEDDMRSLIPLGLNVRLCKGAYIEPPQVAFSRKEDINANLMRLMEMMLSQEAREAGGYPALATHDEKIIDWCKGYVQGHYISNGAFEFQFLHGLAEAVQGRLVQEGYRVRAYVPYGRQWYPYFMRRLAERPAILFVLLANVFK